MSEQANIETQWAVWSEDINGNYTAEVKKSRLAAKRAYNKLSGQGFKTYGWTYINCAEPQIRKQLGLSPFPEKNYPL